MEEGVFPEKISILPNVVDVDFFHPANSAERKQARRDLAIAEQEIVLVCVSNLRPVKDVATLIEAAAIVSRSYPAARFLVIGEGPLRAQLQKLIATLNLENNVSLCGIQSDIRTYLAAADMGVLTSVSEGSSNAVLEYMAAGLPTVLSDIPANQELASHALFPVGDATKLSAQIMRLLSSPEERQRIGDENRRKALKFGFEPWTKMMQAYYAQGLRKISLPAASAE